MARTSSGANFQALVMSGATVGGESGAAGTGSYAPAFYIALTESATGNSTNLLPGELNATSGGLNRASAAASHTAGVSSYTLLKQFTMNSSDGTSRTPQQIGVFNAASAGTIVFQTAIPNPPTMVPGDQLTLTETVNI